MRFRFIHTSFVFMAMLAAVLAPARVSGQEAAAAISADIEPAAPPAEAAGNAPKQTEDLPAAPTPNQQGGPAAQPDVADAVKGSIAGTVTDYNGDLVPGATVVLEGPGVKTTVTADDNGLFTFGNLAPGLTYHVTVSATGFDNWSSPPVVLTDGQVAFVKDIQLKISNAVTSVTVTASTEQIATEQVALEEKQRVLGIIPNFYVVYDSQNAVPMTAKLKMKMALRVSVDPISFIGAAFLGGINQAADTPDYQQGLKGYGQRVGAVYADGFTDLLFGGAILPIVLHQDPRYFYQGTGTTRSRLFHAMKAPFICKGDNGKWQPNYSTVGGDLISAGLSNTYYPKSNQSVGFVFETLGINTAERMASTVIQEFLLRKLTPSAKQKN